MPNFEQFPAEEPNQPAKAGQNFEQWKNDLEGRAAEFSEKETPAPQDINKNLGPEGSPIASPEGMMGKLTMTGNGEIPSYGEMFEQMDAWAKSLGKPKNTEASPENAGKKVEEVEGLIRNVGELVNEISETYVNLKRWEFLLEYPDEDKDSFLTSVGPEVTGLLVEAKNATRDLDLRLREELFKTCKKLEENGFGFIAKEALASLSVFEKKNGN